MEEQIVYVNPLVTVRADGGYEITYPVIENDSDDIKYRPKVVRASALNLIKNAKKAIAEDKDGEAGITDN